MSFRHLVLLFKMEGRHNKIPHGWTIPVRSLLDEYNGILILLLQPQ